MVSGARSDEVGFGQADLSRVSRSHAAVSSSDALLANREGAQTGLDWRRRSGRRRRHLLGARCAACRS